MKSAKKFYVNQIIEKASKVIIDGIADEEMLRVAVKKLRELLKSRLPKVFIITGEDLYEEGDLFYSPTQEMFEMEDHTKVDVCFNPAGNRIYPSGYYKNPSNEATLIIGLSRVDVSEFVPMLFSTLSPYLYVFLAEDKTTVQDIALDLQESVDLHDVYRRMTNRGIIIYGREDGGSITVICRDNYVDVIRKYCEEQ